MGLFGNLSVVEKEEILVKNFVFDNADPYVTHVSRVDVDEISDASLTAVMDEVEESDIKEVLDALINISAPSVKSALPMYGYISIRELGIPKLFIVNKKKGTSVKLQISIDQIRRDALECYRKNIKKTETRGSDDDGHKYVLYLGMAFAILWIMMITGGGHI